MTKLKKSIMFILLLIHPFNNLSKQQGAIFLGSTMSGF